CGCPTAVPSGDLMSSEEAPPEGLSPQESSSRTYRASVDAYPTTELVTRPCASTKYTVGNVSTRKARDSASSPSSTGTPSEWSWAYRSTSSRRSYESAMLITCALEPAQLATRPMLSDCALQTPHHGAHNAIIAGFPARLEDATRPPPSCSSSNAGNG